MRPAGRDGWARQRAPPRADLTGSPRDKRRRPTRRVMRKEPRAKPRSDSTNGRERRALPGPSPAVADDGGGTVPGQCSAGKARAAEGKGPCCRSRRQEVPASRPPEPFLARGGPVPGLPGTVRDGTSFALPPSKAKPRGARDDPSGPSGPPPRVTHHSPREGFWRIFSVEGDGCSRWVIWRRVTGREAVHFAVTWRNRLLTVGRERRQGIRGGLPGGPRAAGRRRA